MTTARQIIRDALSFGLNKLAPGEVEDADTFDLCLRALNSVADEWSGSRSFLWRTVLSSGAVNGTSGALGTTWSAVPAGTEIVGATYSDGSQDIPLSRLTMAQYHEQIALKTTGGAPMYWAHDGASTVYFYPAPTGQSIKLRTRQAVTQFADLDTDYSMPEGYRSALADCMADRVAPTLAPVMAQQAAARAKAARNRIAGQALEPAIIDAACVTRGNILAGWR